MKKKRISSKELNEPDIQSKLAVEKRTTRNLSRLYIAALTAVALLTIVGQLLVQNAIRKQLSDSRIINLAGTQRYKCQQIAKLTLLIYTDLVSQKSPDKVEALHKFLKQWKEGYLGLQHGNEELNLPGNNSEQIQKMFTDLDPYFRDVYNGALSIATAYQQGGNQRQLKDALDKVLEGEGIFLEKMDRIVHQYDFEAKQKVVFLRRTEWILMALTLAILIFEGIFIFRPATFKIKNTIVDLVRAEAHSSALAEKLLETNASLERSIKDLKDINFALDNATILVKTDKYGLINYVNDKFCEISKYSREELMGSRFGVMSGHYHSKAFFDNLWETISSGRIWNNEIKNRAKDGTYFWLDATIVPVLDKNNTPVQYIAIYTDVTQRFKQSIHEQKIRSVSVLEGQERERRKIARELHDGLGQMLTALKFTIEGLKPAMTKSEKNKQEDIRNLVQETIAEVRKISFNLMPGVLSDFGIPAALKHLTEMVTKSSGKNVIFKNHSDVGRLSKTVEINLYRIVQEALNNAIKYSDADEVKVILENDDDSLHLEIEDNGKGFNKSKTLNGKPKADYSGNGIINIQERTSLIDGQFNITTAPGQGTHLSIKIPLTKHTNENHKNSVS